MLCRYCLEEIKNNARLCPFCGQEQPARARKAQRRERAKTALVWVCLILVAALVAVWAISILQ